MNKKLRGGSFIAAGLVTCAAFGFAAFNPSVVRDGKKSFDSNNGKGSIAANASVNVLANESDIDSMLTYTVSSNSINLNGNSIVIKKTSTEENDGVNIFLDANHDGVADNDRPFMYEDGDGNKTSDIPADLSVYGLSGYKEENFEGDMTVYMQGGQVKRIIGAQSGGTFKKVDGKVGVYVSGGKVTSGIKGVSYISADTVDVKVTGGEVNYDGAFGIAPALVGAEASSYSSNVTVGDVNVEITGNACLLGAGAYSESAAAKATYGATVTGDVNIKIGAAGEGNIFGLNGAFVGVNSSTVAGDVNYELVGNAESNGYLNMISGNSKVAGILNIAWKNGMVTSNSYNYEHMPMVRNSTVKSIKARAQEDAEIGCSYFVLLYKSTVDDIDVDLTATKAKISSDLNSDLLNESTYKGKVNNGGIIRYDDQYGRKECDLYGEYNIKKNMDVTSMYVCGANANVTVDKGVTVSVEKNNIDTGSITTAGAFNNNGIIEAEGYFSTIGTGTLINNGQIDVAQNIQLAINGELTNEGRINVGANFTSAGAKIINNGDLIINGRATFNYNKDAETDEIINNKDAYLAIAGRSTICGFTLVNKGEINLGMNTSERYGVDVTYWNGGEKLGKIINYGKIYGSTGVSLGGTSIFDNYGEFDLLNSTGNNNGLSIMNDAYLINREGATLKFKSDIYNLGYIYNYGKCIQKGKGNSLGTIICVKNIDFELSDESILANNENHIFYPVAFSYPDAIKKITTVAIEIGVMVDESDETLYAEFGKYVSVKVNEMADGYTFADIESVAFVGSDDVFDASEDNIFSGLMPANKAEIVINVKSSDGKQITLDTNEINVAPLKVGVDAGTVYDLTTIKISNDGNTGTVKYVESALNPLPEGLEIVDGKIVGTPEKAYEEGFEAKVVITGKNLTRASVTVKFEKINKGTPKFTTPKVFGYEGDTLRQVKISSTNLGFYGWKEDVNSVLDSDYNEETGYTLYFYPIDPDNYDWSLIEAGEWDAANARLEINVKIDIRKKGTPEKTPVVAPLVYEFSANANAIIADVELPKIDEGVFAFVDSADTKLETGTYEVIFTPNDVETIEWLLSTEALEHEAKINEDGSISYKATVTVAKEEAKDVKEEQNIDDNKKEITKPAKREGYSEEAKSDISYGPAVGTKLTLKNYIYKVTKVGTKDSKVIGEVSVVGYKKKTVKKVNVASVVKIDGVTYNVTAIGNKAFKNKKVTKVTIGKNVKTIGANAFAGNKKLKKVTVKSNVISKIGKKAFFRKGGKKLVIKVPKKLKKKYKKLLKKAKTNKYIVK